MVKPNCTLEEARQILVGESWALIGMDVSLEVEDGDFGKNVKKVIIDDGIPF